MGQVIIVSPQDFQFVRMAQFIHGSELSPALSSPRWGGEDSPTLARSVSLHLPVGNRQLVDYWFLSRHPSMEPHCSTEFSKMILGRVGYFRGQQRSGSPYSISIPQGSTELSAAVGVDSRY